MRATGEALRRWSIRRLICGVIHVLCVCGAVSAANMENAGGECECERQMRHCEGGEWGAFFAAL